MTAKTASAGWVSLLRYAARGLLILWAGFWIFFAVASALSETSPLPGANLTGWLVVAIGTLLLTGGAFLPWIWERLGGFVLLSISVIIFIFFLIASEFDLNLWMFLIILPAVIGGGLSLVCWYCDKRMIPTQG